MKTRKAHHILQIISERGMWLNVITNYCHGNRKTVVFFLTGVFHRCLIIILCYSSIDCSLR